MTRDCRGVWLDKSREKPPHERTTLAFVPFARSSRHHYGSLAPLSGAPSKPQDCTAHSFTLSNPLRRLNPASPSCRAPSLAGRRSRDGLAERQNHCPGDFTAQEQLTTEASDCSALCFSSFLLRVSPSRVRELALRQLTLRPLQTSITPRTIPHHPAELSHRSYRHFFVGSASFCALRT